MGQYTQVDPIGLAGGNPTLYGYVFNPSFEIDIWGLARWRLGEPINTPMPDGRYPSWETARRRYWRNRWNNGPSGNPPFEWNDENIRNMRRGRAPLDANGRPIELHHHTDTQAAGRAGTAQDVHRQDNLREVTREQHIDEHRRMREEANRNGNNNQGSRNNTPNSRGCPLP